ncbi:hypothetical protein SDC9_121976 [bioreactor metagenome]|uniref:Uncharacterized protein n=1 Tax=bioreactor metagenome TaxID=1076179 RepID=A0A645CDD5_9ZZZZ
MGGEKRQQPVSASERGPHYLNTGKLFRPPRQKRGTPGFAEEFDLAVEHLSDRSPLLRLEGAVRRAGVNKRHVVSSEEFAAGAKKHALVPCHGRDRGKHGTVQVHKPLFEAGAPLYHEVGKDHRLRMLPEQVDEVCHLFHDAAAADGDYTRIALGDERFKHLLHRQRHRHGIMRAWLAAPLLYLTAACEVFRQIAQQDTRVGTFLIRGKITGYDKREFR